MQPAGGPSDKTCLVSPVPHPPPDKQSRGWAPAPSPRGRPRPVARRDAAPASHRRRGAHAEQRRWWSPGGAPPRLSGCRCPRAWTSGHTRRWPGRRCSSQVGVRGQGAAGGGREARGAGLRPPCDAARPIPPGRGLRWWRAWSATTRVLLLGPSPFPPRHAAGDAALRPCPGPGRQQASRVLASCVWLLGRGRPRAGTLSVRHACTPASRHHQTFCLQTSISVAAGSGRGIGFNTAKLLAWMGASVYVADVNVDAVREAVAGVRKLVPG